MLGGTFIDLDHNATSPLRPAAFEAMSAALLEGGNASAVHGKGRAARARLEDCRRRILQFLGADGFDLVFTGGGSEANNLALRQTPGPVLTSAIEHPSVLAARDAVRAPVTEKGVVSLAALERLIAETAPALVSIMLANNETGVIQPVAEAARLARGHGALVHVDAVQALGRMPLDAALEAADLLTFSAHKAGGPLGLGFLLARKSLELEPLVRGGAQEGRMRAGTENLPAIAGLAAALEAIPGHEPARLAALRDAMERELAAAIPTLQVVGGSAERLCNTSALALPGLEAQTQVMALDLEGIGVSAGAACSSGKVGTSHVLAAMGIEPAIATSTIRVSLGHTTTGADMERFVDAFRRLAFRRPGRRAGRGVATSGLVPEARSSNIGT